MSKWNLLVIILNNIVKVTRRFLRYTLLVHSWTPFTFRSALFLRGTNSATCWKHSSETLVHVGTTASHSCTSMVWLFCTTTTQRSQSEMIWASWLGAWSCWKHVSKYPPLHHQQPPPVKPGRMEPCFHGLYNRFWPCHINVVVEIRISASFLSPSLFSSIFLLLLLTVFLTSLSFSSLSPGPVLSDCNNSKWKK